MIESNNPTPLKSKTKPIGMAAEETINRAGVLDRPWSSYKPSRRGRVARTTLDASSMSEFAASTRTPFSALSSTSTPEA